MLCFDVSAATTSARGGLKDLTSLRLMSCHIGIILVLFPAIAIVTKPRSSYSGHLFLTNALLMTTTPYLELARPLSIDRERLSPNFSVNSSYHTLTSKSFS